MLELKYKNDQKVLRLENKSIGEGELPLLKYNIFEGIDFVEHSFTTRLGGVSSEHLSSLNLSFTRGDDPENVAENFRRLAMAMDVSPESFVFTDQTHTTNVMRVGKEHMGCGLFKDRGYTDIDGLVTNEEGVVLSTFYADCVPLYFVDPVNKAVGLSHSGWKGTVGRMGKATLEKMRDEFGTDPADVVAAIGPSICQSCYEISSDVAVRFMDEFPEHVDEILINKGNDKYLLDLWRSNEIVLTEAGVRSENIAVTNLCTCCNSKLLFSHRASNGMRGNLGAFIYLRK